MNKTLSTIIVGTLLSTSLYADFTRIEVGAGAWIQTPSGTTKYDSGAGVTGTNVFNETKDSSAYAWMLVKHSIPIIPNIRLEYVGVHATGKASGTWKGFAIPVSANSVMDIKEYDIIPYYNLLDNTFWVTLDVGIDVKILDFDYQVKPKEIFKGYKETYTTPIPLLYVRVRGEIPTTNIGIEGDGKYVTTGSSTIYDARVKIDYTFTISPIIQPAIEIGYRIQKIKIDENDLDVKTDMKFSGFFTGLMLRF